MADFTAEARGINRMRRARKTAEIGDGANKGQLLRRYEIDSDTVIKGGEVFILASQTVANNDTFTITVKAT
jgi:hypothetical protein